MTWKKLIAPGERLPLKLTAAQRKLVLDGLLCLDQVYEQTIRETSAGEPVMMTLDDLDDFGGYVAAEANHCRDKKKQKALDAIFDKIQGLLDTHTDEEPAKTLKIDDARKALASSSTQMAFRRAKSSQGRKPKAKSPSAAGSLYQFKITLLGTEPPIWRRIQVQDCTFDKLHEHIQTAMGWTNSHLHRFEIKGQCYGDPELLDDGFDDFECVDSTRTMVSDIVSKAGKQFAFKYEYDFGDSWEHEVLFEGCSSVQEDQKYPFCLEGERACPPEDVGGVWGYQDFLAAIADPKHEQHKSLLRWCGGKFSPDDFDPAKATNLMKQGLPDWRTM